jgi:hypothetical protein
MSRSRGRKGRTGSSSYYQADARPRQQQVVTEPVRRGEVIELGELGGTERDPLTASFSYFGEEFRVHPDLSELDIIDFAEASENLKPDDPASMSIIKKFVRQNLHPGDFERFWSAVRAHRQTAEETMELMWKVIEGVTGNPTGQPSASAAGRPVTTQQLPATASGPESANGDLRARYLAQIERFEATGTGNGVAMAAQVAAAAEARGVDISREPVASGNVSG